MTVLPTGSVTFLFTDVEGSTRLFQQDPEAMKDALARHHALVQGAIGAHRGHVFHVLGDGFCSAFEDAGDALQAALAAQRALHSEDWGLLGALRVRMGLHTGNAEAHDGDYVASLTLARAQRVSAAGHGGQVLLSAATADSLATRLPPGTTLRNLGTHKLRGVAQPETLYQFVAADLPSEFPPLRIENVAASAAAPLQQLVRGRLVGRAAEQQQLRHRWSEAQQARGQMVLLSGEPGVGKSRLAIDLIEHARQAGATVLRGGCYEFEATTPYLPFVEAFREWARWQPAARLQDTLAHTPEIGKFAPEIETRVAAAASRAALSPSEERLRLFDHAARFLRSLAAGTGLLVFIDDIHWADQGTLSLLHYLLRNLRNDRVLFLAAYREIELDRSHPLASALVDWNRERLAVRVQLGRLPHADAGALIAALLGVDRVSDELASALYRETEGNPFFVEEVIKALIEQGEIYREGESWGRKEMHELSIPQSVKEAIGRRLTRLPEPTVDALRTAAALGKHFRFGELAAVSAGNDDALLDALDEANAAQLVRVASDGARSGTDDVFVFTHDKIREVLYEELNPIRRRRLHQRIGEALEVLHGTGPNAATAADERAQDLAHHFTLAGDLAKSMAYSLVAARDAERMYAHDEALKFLEQARESAEVLRQIDELARIDEQIGDIRDVQGMTHPAVESYERALRGAGTAGARAAIKAKIGSSYCGVGDPRGLPFVEQALAELDPTTQANALALALANMGRYYHYRTEHRKAIEFLERARRLAEPVDDPLTLDQIYSFLAGAHQHLALYDESIRWAETSIALGDRRNSPTASASGYEFLGENAAGRGHWDDARAFGAKDREYGERAGSLARVAWSWFCELQAQHGKGELVAGHATAVAALTLSEQIAENRLATWLVPMMAMFEADLGNDGAARETAERGWALAERLGQLVLSAWALHGAGYAALQRGDFSEALERYDHYLKVVQDTENRVARLVVGAFAAEAYACAGRLDEAARLADQARELAEFAKAPHRIALARRVQGRTLMMQARFDDAENAFDDAIAIFTRLGSRLEHARAICQRAESGMRRGTASDIEAARAGIASARDEFAAMGAASDRARAERLLDGRSSP